MRPLQLYSEPYRPEGNIDAKAARRAIGRPHLDFWTLFFREILQNSWDARLPDSSSIDFSVDGFFATKRQLNVLTSTIFAEEPPDWSLGTLLGDGDVPLLVITDRHTTGLEGPTRADLATDDATHFVDFVRNIGRAEDKSVGGGTYGFGKGVLYDASMCSTIVIFTRTRFAGVKVSRLIAIGLGSSYDDGRLRFTGRHWWGVASKLTGAEPLEGIEAEHLAAELGMDAIPADETGTTIMIVGPVAEQDAETLHSIVTRIANAATFWAWPHMVGRGAGATVRFRFAADGEEVVAPSPAADPVFRHYVGAYRRATAILDGRQPEFAWPWQDHEIRSGRTRLGALVYRHVPREQLASRLQYTDSLPCGNVALMRNPRLVVRYLDVPPDTQGLATFGVFIADPDLDRQFAMSEPVAHDDWAPENLRTEKYQRNPVRQALDHIRRVFRSATQVRANTEPGGRFAGVVRLASSLGTLIEGQPGGVDPGILGPGTATPATGTPDTRGGGGDAPGGPPGPGAGQGHRRRSALRAAVVGQPRVALHRGCTAAVFTVQVTVPPDQIAQLAAEGRVILDGGTAEALAEAPIGADRPVVLGWTSDDHQAIASGSAYRIEEPGDHEITLWISQPDDTAVTAVVHVVDGAR